MALSFSCCASLNTQFQAPTIFSRSKGFEAVRNLITKTVIPSIAISPVESLQKGNWVKLICGASFEDVVDVRNLSLVYTLAGVDCIDCAAEGSIVNAVNEGIEAARRIVSIRRPWVMISVNDDEDLHFRKAEFNPDECPPDCSRPCERVCPADAISVKGSSGMPKGGVMAERCYGCGRCIPVCPYDRIRALTYVRDAPATAELLTRNDVDAIEIHTSGSSLQFMADGRPMSGDIGRGATKEAIAFALRLVSAGQKPKGFLQLAGGTNAHTVDGLKKEKLFQTILEKSVHSDFPTSHHTLIGGVAFGGYARKIVGRVMTSAPSYHMHPHIEDHPELLLKAVMEALALVGTVKCYSSY